MLAYIGDSSQLFEYRQRAFDTYISQIFNLINLNMCKYISYNSINIIINFGIIVFITNVARQYLHTLQHKEP